MPIGADAAHAVVGGGCHRDGGLRGLESQFAAAPQDRGELPLELAAAHGPEVEPEMGGLALPHALDEGPTDGVTGCQVSAAELADGALPLVIDQAGPFSAHRFGDQEVGGPRQHQGRGVELDELQVPHRSTGAIGHGDAVTAGLFRVGRVRKEVAGAAGGQHDRPGLEPTHRSVQENLEAAAVAVLHPKLKGQTPLEALQAGTLQHLALQGVDQGSTGAVLGVENTAMAVGGFQGGAEPAVLAVKVHPQLQQPFDAGRGLTHEQLHGGAIAEIGAGLEGVLEMALEAVFRPGHRGDAALGPAAGGAGCAVFAQQEDAEARG